jgi:hypothetical protein
MEAKVQTHNSPGGVCDGKSDTKEVFLSEKFVIIDFKISPIRSWYNRHISDHSTEVHILLHL